MEQRTRYQSTNLDRVLADQGRKQRWLARRVGVSESLVSMLISGERTISADMAERIAAALDVPLFLLFELSVSSESLPTEAIPA